MAQNEKRSVVFLCSGGGGNLAFINNFFNSELLGASIVSVLADRECPALNFARKNQLKWKIINFDENFQNQLKSELLSLNPDLIITTVHKIICKELIELFPRRFINLHYSLLPSFKGLIGMRPVQSAFECGVKFTGVTTHFVDSTLDGGLPIVQIVIPLVDQDKNNLNFKSIVFRCGCIALINTITHILFPKRVVRPYAKLHILGRPCLLSGHAEYIDLVHDEVMWSKVAGSIN